MRRHQRAQLAHGTTCSISSRNIARRVFLVYCSKPVIIARVLCFISQTLKLDRLWKAESLIRVSLEGKREKCGAGSWPRPKIVAGSYVAHRRRRDWFGDRAQQGLACGNTQSFRDVYSSATGTELLLA